MAELTNELFTSLLRDLDAGLSALSRKLDHLSNTMDEGFRRLDAHQPAHRYRRDGQIDYDLLRTDMQALRSRIAALELKAARTD